MQTVPYFVGRFKQRRIGGYWVCSPEDAVWALSKEWSLKAGGYVCEKQGELAHRLIKNRERVEQGLAPALASEDVHHRDKDIKNNQRSNLVMKDHGKHAAEHNRDVGRRNNSLPPGVAVSGKRFRARASVRGVQVYLGTFDTPEEASVAYQQALKESSSEDA